MKITTVGTSIRELAVEIKLNLSNEELSIKLNYTKFYKRCTKIKVYLTLISVFFSKTEHY